MKNIPSPPPKVAQAILKRLIDRDIRYGAMGDLEEQYYAMSRELGPFKACLHYWLQIPATLPGFIKNAFTWSLIMFTSHAKVFIRSLKKHKGFSFINFIGLTIGISIFMLIMLYVQHEMGFDKSHKNLPRIYRIQGQGGRQLTTAPAVGKWISEQIPDVEKTVRFKQRNDYLAKYRPEISPEQEHVTVIPDFAWADPTVFEIFTFSFISGDPSTALSDPYSLVLTKSYAERLFGKEYPVGKSILINNQHNYRVTAVIDDLRQNHLKFDSLASFETLGKIIGRRELDSFNSWNLTTFVLLPENHDAAAVGAKVTNLFRAKLKELWKVDFSFELFPLEKIYFTPKIFGHSGNLQLVYVFIAIGVFILLIASVNFINLSTARASLRAKEVGIKKVIGSSRKSLIAQFLLESIFFSVLAFLAALGLAAAFLPEFNRLILRNLSMGYFFSPLIFFIFLAGAVLLGAVSGFYPAFYLSAFQPVAVLKGEKQKGARSQVFRKFLISFQFAISIILIIGTLTVLKQTHYVKNKDLGFRKDPIIYMEIARNRGIRTRKQEFKERLLQHSHIQNVTLSQGRPGLVYNWEGFELQGKRSGYAIFTVDPDYFDVYNLEIIEGRNFSRKTAADQYRTCLLNEAAVKKLGLESPVGTVFHHDNLGGSAFPVKEVEVIGVVKDFHYQSLHHDIQPMMFGWNNGWTWMVSAQISPQDIPGTIDYIGNVWNEFSPDYPFTYEFIDEMFASQYHSEERLGKSIGYFAILGILIACLGLFGLVSFMAEQRTKEIGIRKVLGASVSGIIIMLSKEFSRWVLLANITAWPIAYFAMHKWLQSFAYRTNIGIGTFLLSALLAFAIAMFTVSYQALRAATANPVDSLRYE